MVNNVNCVGSKLGMDKLLNQIKYVETNLKNM
ncbi:hypothetical protein CoNPh26_CDS0135 [Staphylococcus phage S-CoN_Ph26]|nr:hypothetical protein CoNPh26_CDS0135 [Staphylococcus phage S-CoN_Ph26]